MKSYTELFEEVKKTQKDPRYLKHANRELRKLRQKREDDKNQQANIRAAHDDARARLKEREIKRERLKREAQQKNNIVDYR